MSKPVATGAYPALLMKEGDLFEQKLILKAAVPGGDPLHCLHYVAFEISNPVDHVKIMLELTHYDIQRSILALPSLSPEGTVTFHRWVCFASVRAVGWVAWNKKYGAPKLDSPRLYLPPLNPFFCIVDETTDNPIEHPHLSNNDAASSSENSLSSSEAPNHHLVNMVEDEIPQGEMLESQTMKADVDVPTSALVALKPAPEQDMEKLFPDDPFGMGFV